MVRPHSQHIGSSDSARSSQHLCFLMAASSSAAPPAEPPAAAVAALPAERQEDAQTAEPLSSEPTAKALNPLWPVNTEGASLVPEIARLKKEQAALRDQKKRLAKDLKNAEKRRSRLKKRAKLLTNTDLVAVMMLRVAERKVSKIALVEPTVAGAAAQSVEMEGK